MSKTYELLEKVVTDEFKSQNLEANNNVYLAAYIAIAGALLLHVEEIFTSFKKMFKSSGNEFYIYMAILFAFMLVAGIICFIFQCLRIRLPKADKFAPNLDICRYEFEERRRLLAGEIAHKQVHSEKIDTLISDIIRLRMIENINEVTKELQRYNRNKRWLQRVTGFCLLIASFMGGQAIVNAMSLKSSRTQPLSHQQTNLHMSKPSLD